MWCRLEIFVGLASFTGCLVSVDKLYLFYSTCFYKTMALLSDKWEPELTRAPRGLRWVRTAGAGRLALRVPRTVRTGYTYQPRALGTYRVNRGTRRWEPTNRYPQRWKKSVAQNPPKVCVQLPMFNETFVARRVIDYTCRMDYPRHAFEVPALP